MKAVCGVGLLVWAILGGAYFTYLRFANADFTETRMFLEFWPQILIFSVVAIVLSIGIVWGDE